MKWSESRSVVSDCLQPCGQYSLWNSAGQNTGVSSPSLFQGIFPTQGSNPGLPHCRQVLYQLSHQGNPQYLTKFGLWGGGQNRRPWPWNILTVFSLQFSSVTQLCPTLCDPMDCSMPGLPVHHQLLELVQTHVHWVGDAIQLSHPLSSPSPPAFLFSSLAHFLIGSFIFLELSCRSCLYIFEISCLSVASFAIIFSHSEGCLFTLLIVSFVVQKLLS